MGDSIVRKYWTKNALGKTMAALLLMANLSQPAANASTSAPTEDFGVIPGTVESYDSTAEEILTEAAASKNLDTSVDSELSFFGNKGPYTIVSQWTDKNGKLVYLREKARAKTRTNTVYPFVLHKLQQNMRQKLSAPATAMNIACPWIIFPAQVGDLLRSAGKLKPQTY